MEIRNAIHPDHYVHMNTEQLRKHFLINDLFAPQALKLIYSYYDRLIVGSALPVNFPLEIQVDEKIIGTAHLLDRREMGIINIGGEGVVTVDNRVFELQSRDGLYVGMGSQNISFNSKDSSRPAMFYFNCAPAHRAYPTTPVICKETEAVELGEIESSNKRTIRKYIHPDGVQSCQLVMGMTQLSKGCVWNTMPVHTHQRRMEAYLYFDLPSENVVFHLMGDPAETRHLVVRNQEAVLSPSWSIHSGAGTSSYTFIWGMVGENQTFTDMDGVSMGELK